MAIASMACAHAQQAPDTILYNGKIVTVDDIFSIQEAVAIRGDRIAAVGDNDRMLALAGPDTWSVDLGGRTVIPGLIDNHNHIIRATEYWPNEARLDGLASRQEALALLEAKANSLPEGEWLMSLGGWTENQFSDSRTDFTLAELDAIAPGRPAFIQSTYDHAIVNTAWLSEMGIPLTASSDSPQPSAGLASYVVRDADGVATGRMNGGITMVALAIEQFPEVSADRQISAIKSSFLYLNSIGLTSVYDPGGLGIRKESYDRITDLAKESGLTLRVFHTLGGGSPSTPEEARAVVGQIKSSRPFQGDESVDLIAVGEIYYSPFHRDSLFEDSDPSPEDIAAAKGHPDRSGSRWLVGADPCLASRDYRPPARSHDGDQCGIPPPSATMVSDTCRPCWHRADREDATTGNEPADAQHLRAHPAETIPFARRDG